MSPLILASASSQRKSLLEGLGAPFVVHPSAVDESLCKEADPVKRCTVLATLKAQTVAKLHPGAFVLGCDTLVVANDGTLFEKPINHEDAASMLRLLSGSTFSVHSCLHLIAKNEKTFDSMDSTKVTFKELSEADIAWWISLGLWEGRSGAFQIEGPGQLLVKKLEGDWTSVVGLPVYVLGEMLRDSGYTY